MASLISDSTKKLLSAELNNVAVTFERPISISQEAQKIIISTNPNFNRFQSSDTALVGQNPENYPIVFTTMARILYEKDQPIVLSAPFVGGIQDDSQLKLGNQEGRVRIKINASGGSIIKDAKLIELDGVSFNIDSAPRSHGLFSGDYWTIYLKRQL